MAESFSTESQPSDSLPSSSAAASIQRMVVSDSNPTTQPDSSFPSIQRLANSNLSQAAQSQPAETQPVDFEPEALFETNLTSSDSGKIQRSVDNSSTENTADTAIQHQTEANQSPLPASAVSAATSATLASDDGPESRLPQNSTDGPAESSQTASTQPSSIQRSLESPESNSPEANLPGVELSEESAELAQPYDSLPSSSAAASIQRMVASESNPITQPDSSFPSIQRLADSNLSQTTQQDLTTVSTQTTETQSDAIQRTTTPAAENGSVVQQPVGLVSEGQIPPESVQRSVTSDQPVGIPEARKESEESKTVQLGGSIQLPTVLKPLGVLRSLPALELRSQPTHPSDLENAKVLRSESETIQRQATEGDIPGEWSNLESLVADLTGGGQGDANIQRQIAEPDTGHDTNSKTDDEPDGETTSQTNGEIIQRQGADGDVPSEWSNLENLVTHLKGNTSNSESAKTSIPQPPSSPEAKTDIKPNDAKPNDIESSVQSSSAQSSSAQPARPAAMPVATIQRRVARPSPASKPVLIQACQDTSTATITSESDEEQTDGIRDYSRYLELLAQEVYSLLRQRLSLEQERRGPKYPR
ncbi:MAG: hypothetical protein AAFV72_18655 [Cyanobacteria bacterium J06635_1]